MTNKTDKRFYNFLVIEIRPKLQSVNVFISLQKPLVNPIVKLNENNFQFCIGDDIYTVNCKDLKLKTGSLTSLRVDSNFLSFRCATETTERNQGSFNQEVLQNVSESMKPSVLPPVLTNSSCVMKCGNCDKIISKVNTKFNRVLPLPSENSDPSDWFCHGHGSSQKVNLDPGSFDAFTSCCYVHLNKGNLVHVRINSKMMVCDYCLNWLGLNLNDNSVRLWFNTVKFLQNQSEVFTNPLTDVFISINELFRNVFFGTMKVIFSCQITESVNNYILIWILEKQLNIFYDHSKLENHNVAKVLFKFIEGSDPLLKSWESDQLTQSIQISKPMAIAILHHLHKFNKVFPPEFRNSNSMNVSYLFMYN